MIKNITKKTTIVVKKITRDRLASKGDKDSTFDDILSKLLDKFGETKNE